MTARAAWWSAALVVVAVQDGPTPQRAGADAQAATTPVAATTQEGTDPLVAAWLHDLLGSPAETSLAAYRLVADDHTARREQRVRAAARALPLALANEQPEHARVFATVLRQSMPNRGADVDQVIQRMRRQIVDMRAAAVAQLSDNEFARKAAQAGPDPLRGLEDAIARANTAASSVERELSAAEQRGDTAEAMRLRRIEPPQRAFPPIVRRRAVEALEHELAGRHEQAVAILDNVLRRPPRAAWSLARFEHAMRERQHANLGQREQDLLQRALEEARKRDRSGNAAGVQAILNPVVLLLRP